MVLVADIGWLVHRRCCCGSDLSDTDKHGVEAHVYSERGSLCGWEEKCAALTCCTLFTTQSAEDRLCLKKARKHCSSSLRWKNNYSGFELSKNQFGGVLDSVSTLPSYRNPSQILLTSFSSLFWWETEVLMTVNDSFSLNWRVNTLPTAGVLFPELAPSKSQNPRSSVKDGMGKVNRCASLAQE